MAYCVGFLVGLLGLEEDLQSTQEDGTLKEAEMQHEQHSKAIKDARTRLHSQVESLKAEAGKVPS